MRKLFVSFLCVIMVMVFIPTMVFAAEEPETPGTVTNESTQEQYASLAEAVAESKADDVLTLSAGVFTVDSTIAVNHSLTISGFAKGYSIVKYSGSGYIFTLGGTDQEFAFSHIVFRGQSTEAGTAFKLGSTLKTESFSVIGCVFEQLKYGIYNGDNYYGAGYTSNVLIEDCDFACGLVGAYFERVDTFTADGNNFTGASQAGLQIYAPLETDAEIESINISYNDFSGNTGYGLSLQFYDKTAVGSLNVTANTGTDDARYAVGPEAVGNIQNVTFDGNEFDILSRGHVTNETKGTYYSTIQEAVDAAAAGDVIVLGADTYNENLNIDTAVTIKGPETGEAIIKFNPVAKQARDYIGRTTYPVIYATADLTLENVTVAGPTDTHHGIDGILAKAGLKMDNVTVRDIRCTADGGFVCGVQYGLGVMAEGTGDVTITNSKIIDFQKQAIDLCTSGNVLIENNEIAGVGEQAIIAQNGIVVRTGSATIADNTISDMVYTADNEWSHCSIGVYAIDDAKLTVTGNTISDIDNSLAVSDNAEMTTDKNTLLAPVINYRTDGYVLTVTGNYWGTDEPDFDALIYGEAECYSYYADAAMTTVVCLEHQFEWVVDKEATETEPGLKHEECTICGYEKAAVEIPATGTAADTEDPDEPQTPDNPQTPDDPQTSDEPNKPGNAGDSASDVEKTGDVSGLTMWMLLLTVSAASLGGTLAYSRKKN